MERLTRRFYELSHADPVLGPFFEKTITDFEPHVRVVADFWSSTLLKTSRYKGNPFMAHARHPIEREHFAIWLKLFEQAATETLPPDMVERAMGRARHMARSIEAGMFTLPQARASREKGTTS